MNRVNKTCAKTQLASTEQQELAERLLEEQELTQDEISRVFDVFRQLVVDYAKNLDKIRSTEMKKLLEDAIDQVKGLTRRSNVAMPAIASFDSSDSDDPVDADDHNEQPKDILTECDQCSGTTNNPIRCAKCRFKL